MCVQSYVDLDRARSRRKKISVALISSIPRYLFFISSEIWNGYASSVRFSYASSQIRLVHRRVWSKSH